MSISLSKHISLAKFVHEDSISFPEICAKVWKKAQSCNVKESFKKIPYLDPQDAGLPKFNISFNVQRQIFGRIFMKIQSVVFARSCQQRDRQTPTKT